MTLTIEKGISEGLKSQFIDEIVVLHGFTKINTTIKIQPNVGFVKNFKHKTDFELNHKTAIVCNCCYNQLFV
jgi:hypothetical protein